MKLSRSTAARWIRLARQKGNLGPSEGPGRAAGQLASIKQRPDAKWRARYRDSGGKEHAQHFRRKTDVQRWLDEITASKVTSQYVDPRAGWVTFRHPPHCVRDVWRAAVKAVSAPHGTGFHELRHYYASLLIRHGESVKVMQAQLGHASASETLDTYSHLWPDSDDRTALRSMPSLLRTLCGLRRWPI